MIRVAVERKWYTHGNAGCRDSGKRRREGREKTQETDG
jgi:hypothetical protein